MAKAKPETTGEGGKQSIEQLQKRFELLNTKRIQAETELKGANKRLDDLKREAREKYDTDDVAELRKKLAQMTAENEQKRAKYQSELDQIETDLETVEQKFAAAESGASGVTKEP